MADAKTTAAATPEKVSPTQYVAQVRQEARKVVWPTWNETLTTTIMVLIFTVIMGALFAVVDTGVLFVLKPLLGLEG